MDVSNLIAKVYSIGYGIYDAERARRRSKQRSAELREAAERVVSVGSTAKQIAPETENVGKYIPKRRTSPILGL